MQFRSMCHAHLIEADMPSLENQSDERGCDQGASKDYASKPPGFFTFPCTRKNSQHHGDDVE